jgi:intracellular multiplication protein IcmO
MANIDPNNFRGPDKEVDPSKYRRDPRSIKEKFSDMMADPTGFLTIMGLVGSLFILGSPFGELWFAISLWLIWYTSTKKFRLPFRIPKSANLLDPGQISPATSKPEMSAGISYFGRERKTGKELWFNSSDLRTHILIFGSTGSGKTEYLLSMAYNALVQGSGLIYVDGKGENVLYTKIFAMARTMGREDDVLVINYMTGSRDVFGPQEKKLSNTLNPFASGSSGGLTELLVSLMDDGGQGGGGDMWKGRAVSLISAIMMALVYMRDKKEILLDVDLIREYLILDNIIKLYKTRKDFPNHIRASLRAYLVSLPGFHEAAPKQSETVMEQHGYLQMQFTKILGSLADNYGFIFKTNLGEVDFKDVVLNRRILVVLLPALEKSTDELANLGKIIVACLKQMMAATLGSTIEGSYEEVVEVKPTNSEMPFVTILDEYGYYAVKGSAVMPAQARSLGFSMIFAGQDLPAFEKASKEEAASIVANCNIKICMKLEDPQSTYELFEKSAGEALVSSVGTLESKSGMLGSAFVPIKNSNLEFKKRINVLDLKDQEPGEAHILFKSTLIRARAFHANPPKPTQIKMNYFVRVEPPDISIINQLDSGLKNMINSISNVDNINELIAEEEIENKSVQKLVELMLKYESLGENEAAFAAVAKLCSEILDSYDERTEKYTHEVIGSSLEDEDEDDENNEDDEAITIFSSAKERSEYIKNTYGHIDDISGFNTNTDSSDESEEEEEEEDENDEDDSSSNLNVFLNEEKTSNEFEKTMLNIGSDKISAAESSRKSVEEIKQISKYPSDGMPSSKNPEEIMSILQELDDMFEEE